MYIGSVDLYTSIDLLGAHVEFHQGEVGVRFVNDKGESVASGVFADIEEARSWAASRGLEVGAWRVE
jgi:hypothetical protein